MLFVHQITMAIPSSQHHTLDNSVHAHRRLSRRTNSCIMMASDAHYVSISVPLSLPHGNQGNLCIHMSQSWPEASSLPYNTQQTTTRTAGETHVTQRHLVKTGHPMCCPPASSESTPILASSKLPSDWIGGIKIASHKIK